MSKEIHNRFGEPTPDEERDVTILTTGKFWNSEKRWQITAEAFPLGQMRICISDSGGSPSLNREAQLELLKLLIRLHPLDALSHI